MSGGSYDYIYSKLEYDLVGRMYDRELDDMIKDLVDVLHDLEWWRSSDIGEEEYRETVKKFKSKWFTSRGRNNNLKKIIEAEFQKLKDELLI